MHQIFMHSCFVFYILFGLSNHNHNNEILFIFIQIIQYRSVGLLHLHTFLYFTHLYINMGKYRFTVFLYLVYLIAIKPLAIAIQDNMQYILDLHQPCEDYQHCHCIYYIYSYFSVSSVSSKVLFILCCRFVVFSSSSFVLRFKYDLAAVAVQSIC